MNRCTWIVGLISSLLLAGCSTPEGPASHLPKANVLPLALDEGYQFRKILLTSFSPDHIQPETKSESILFERARLTYGAVDFTEIERRRGNYYTIFWRNSTRSDVTLRLEYRQAGLASHVIAKERHYPDSLGSHRSTFEVTGDEFLENGPVTAWRAVLIVDGRIVALRQSHMWR
ncbi:MAG: hypothetical protein WCG66_01175 [bacterium]